MLKHFLAVFAARNREFLRDRSSWAWNIIFPVLLVAGLSLAFSDGNSDLFKVGAYPAAQTGGFFNTEYMRFVDVENLDAAIVKVERHQLDMLLDVASGNYWINDSSPKGYVGEKLLLASAGEYHRQTVSGREVRYVDWVIPGLLGMNMMFSCLFGVGYVIVRYRKNGVLKRLKATPLRAFEFLAAQVASRLWLIMGITIAVFVGTNYFLEFTMHGSYFNLLLVFTLGAISLISMGLVVAARTSSEELAGGLLNLASWPMMVLSGVWFSLEGAHPLIQKLALIFPLTHLIDAARAIMIDGAGLLDVWVNVVTLILVTILFMALGSIGFRWE